MSEKLKPTRAFAVVDKTETERLFERLDELIKRLTGSES